MPVSWHKNCDGLADLLIYIYIHCLTKADLDILNNHKNYSKIYINGRIQLFSISATSVDTYKEDLHQIWDNFVETFQCNATCTEVICKNRYFNPMLVITDSYKKSKLRSQGCIFEVWSCYWYRFEKIMTWLIILKSIFSGFNLGLPP